MRKTCIEAIKQLAEDARRDMKTNSLDRDSISECFDQIIEWCNKQEGAAEPAPDTAKRPTDWETCKGRRFKKLCELPYLPPKDHDAAIAFAAIQQARKNWEQELKAPCGTISPVCTEKWKELIRQDRTRIRNAVSALSTGDFTVLDVLAIIGDEK